MFALILALALSPVAPWHHHPFHHAHHPAVVITQPGWHPVTITPSVTQAGGWRCATHRPSIGQP